jgi:hypothetical protein
VINWFILYGYLNIVSELWGE